MTAGKEKSGKSLVHTKIIVCDSITGVPGRRMSEAQHDRPGEINQARQAPYANPRAAGPRHAAHLLLRIINGPGAAHPIRSRFLTFECREHNKVSIQEGE